MHSKELIKSSLLLLFTNVSLLDSNMTSTHHNAGFLDQIESIIAKSIKFTMEFIQTFDNLTVILLIQIIAPTAQPP